MRRRSVLYIANFLVPIMFFFCLDLASFLISDSGGEKLGFKVTVLLAVTVMQLLLNEILPSSSDRVPLIGREAQSFAFIWRYFMWAWTAHELSQCGYSSTLMMLPSPFSGLLHWDVWFDDAKPPGDNFGDASNGERLCIPRQWGR